VLIENLNAATVSGVNNWLQTNATAGPLTGSVVRATPGFRNPVLKDFTLTNGSFCVGAASATVYGLPGKEYFQNEITNRFWRIRAAARDIGAFESTTTNAPIGPYDPIPMPQLTITPGSVGSVVVSWLLFAQDFQLYHSDFSNPLTWSQVPYAYVTNLDGLLTTFSRSRTRDFFRLER
jgi:hypothetical protein